jgi:D-apionate oxidoisomerase
MKLALFGAGGKMGNRITDNLRTENYEMLYVEVSPAGIENLTRKGLAVTQETDALKVAEVIILAVPDVLIGKISSNIVPQMRSGSMLVLLDPAAAYLDQLPARKDISYFVTHPCHPPVFNDETDPAAREDHFGGVAAKQSIVCALMQGPEEHYILGESIARSMYKPILRSHRITVEQMAMLEPAMAETIGGTLAMMYREAMDEAVRRGVPYEAARDFMMGHVQIELAIAFQEIGSPFSDAALVAIEWGKQRIVKPDWKRVFDQEELKQNIDVMLHPEKLKG